MLGSGTHVKRNNMSCPYSIATLELHIMHNQMGTTVPKVEGQGGKNPVCLWCNYSVSTSQSKNHL